MRRADLVYRRIRVWLVSVAATMYIDEQRPVPRRIKWRHGECVGRVRGSGCTALVGVL